MVDVDKLDALLPQTQCEECGYHGCRLYAQALAKGLDTIDKCPPGGEETMFNLARELNLDSAPYTVNKRKPEIAVIRESECIGCLKCINACPVDAIVGSVKNMHSVLNHECTGCRLCVEPCPVDCIDMIEQPELQFDKALAQERFKDKKLRNLRQAQEKELSYREKRCINANREQDKKAKLDYIKQAIARVKAKHE